MALFNGESIKLNITGASHAESIGVEINGIPAGEIIDFDELQAVLESRASGRSDISSSRHESDIPQFLSGFYKGVTTGNVIHAVVYNEDVRKSDYNLSIPRPGHADYTSWLKYGMIVSGGGQFSGRMTVALCIAGGIAKQILEKRGIYVTAGISSIGKVFGDLSGELTEEMNEYILSVKAKGDSVGGQIFCNVSGMPAGIGGPLFEGLESKISYMIFAIPAVKAIEFGTVRTHGSENNDPYYVENGEVKVRSNNHGGILGGISTGADIFFKVKVKPTSSIALEQESVNLDTLENVKFKVEGRHDPCIVPRAVPVVECVTALAVLDSILSEEY